MENFFPEKNNLFDFSAFTASNLEVEVASCIDIMHETDYSFDNVQELVYLCFFLYILQSIIIFDLYLPIHYCW